MSSPQPKYFKAWIAFFVIATIGGGVLGAFIGIILSLVMKNVAHAEPATIRWTIRIVGFLVAMPVSYVGFRYTVEEFIVEDLTKAPSPAPPAEPPPLAKGSNHCA